MVSVRLAKRRVQRLPGASRAMPVSGVLMADERKAAFSRIERDDLLDDARLSALYVEAVVKGWWPIGNREVLEFWCYAEKALQDDGLGTPGRLFHALVKRKDSSRVTDGQERRAQRRMPAGARESLVARAARASGGGPVRVESVASSRLVDADGEASLPAPPSEERAVLPEEGEAAVFGTRKVGYLHSVMMMCFLPQKRLPADEREYVVQHGRAMLQVEAGVMADPNRVGVRKRCAVPFGSRARLILPFINAYAVQNRSREVDLGSSLREFLGRLGMTVDGRRGREITDQIQAVGAAQFTLMQWHEQGTSNSYGRVADTVSFWLEKDARQRTLWEPTMSLSQGYYDALLERPVPVDMGHLMQLTRSPRRMDLYFWLTYRTSRIGVGERVYIRLADLLPVFAPDVEDPALFKFRLKRDLSAIADVYGAFKVSIEGDMVVLERSPPPIAPAGRIALLQDGGRATE